MYGKLSDVGSAPRPSKRSKRRALYASAVLVGAAAFGAADAGAALTQVGASRSRGEATHEQVLEHRFGGNFQQSGANFTNGSVTVSRVDDSADTSYSGNVKSAQVIGAFARKQQCFGVWGPDGQFTELVSVTGRNFECNGSAESMSAALAAADAGDTAGPGGPVTFGRAGGLPTFSADPTKNEDGRDHLVSYSVSGAGVAEGTMLLFWEDATGRRADFDFNDLIVEITAEPLLIPLPAAAWTGLTGLLGLGAVAGYRRVRRRKLA